MATYRTAIIACGMIARVHARGWLGVEGQPTTIGALADTNPDARSEFGDFFHVPEPQRYADYREMLDAERPDFVDICSWHQHHAEMVIAAAARRPKAILCQKPMATSMKEAGEMMMACDRNGVKLIIAYQRPHHATWLKARELIRDGAVGDVRQVEIYCGGNMLNTNSHNIRLGLFLMDEPKVNWIIGAVERTCDLQERGLPAEEASLGLAGCGNGANLVIAGNLIPGMDQGCRVVGTDGLMELGTTRHPDSVIPSDEPMYSPEGPTARYNFEIGTARYFNSSTAGWVEVEAAWHDPWAHQCRNTLDWVESKVEEAISSGQRGLAVQEVMMGLYESARKRQRIYMPLKTMVNPLQLMIDAGDLPVEWPGVSEVRSRIVRGEAMSWHDEAAAE